MPDDPADRPDASRRIAVVSPSPMLTDGIVSALAGVPGWQVTAEAGAPAAEIDAAVLHGRNAADVLALLSTLPDMLPVVLLAHEMSELAGHAAHDDRPLALLSPDAAAEPLRLAVRAVLLGLSLQDRAGFSAAPRTVPGAGFDHDPLTARELEVFELLGKGLSNRDIAGVLDISAHTAKYHVAQILAKVGAATRAEAVGMGLKMGLIGL